MHRSLTRSIAVTALTCAVGALTVAAPAAAAPHRSSAAAEPGSLMLVLDASGSMGESLAGGGTKIAAARAALHDLTGALPDAQQVGLRVFGATRSKSSSLACSDSQRIVDLGTGNRPDLDTAIDAVQPFGETPIGYALQQAGRDLGATGQRSIVLVSDGEPTCAPDPCDVAAALARSGVTLRVDVVGLAVSGAARSKLQCVAAKGGGRYTDADSADDLAAALGSAAIRSAVPFRTSGRPVTGTNTRVDAPLVADGDWTDTLGGVGGDRQTLYYRVHREQADSTLHVSVDAIRGSESDMIGVTLLDDQSRRCGSDTDTGAPGDSDPVLNASVSIPRSLDAADLACAAAGDFVVQVDHGISGSTSFGRRADVPIELRVREEAPVRDVQSLPVSAETPAWTDPDLSGAVSPTVGGDSLASATLLRSGAYSASLSSGEVQTFAVDLDHGQSLAAALRVSVSPLLQQRLRGASSQTLSIRLLSPSRVDAAGSYDFRSDAADHLRATGTVWSQADGQVIYDYTDTVAYRNRFQSAADLQGASESGRYLVVVAMPNAGGDVRRITVPFTLGIAVRGTVAGVPQTATVGPTSVPTGATQASDQGTGVPQTGSQQGSGSGHGPGSSRAGAAGPLDLVRQTAAVGAIGIGAVVVLGAVVLGAVLLTRRRADRS